MVETVVIRFPSATGGGFVVKAVDLSPERGGCLRDRVRVKVDGPDADEVSQAVELSLLARYSVVDGCPPARHRTRKPGLSPRGRRMAERS